MNRNEIFEYVKTKYNTDPEYLWAKTPLHAVLRNDKGKWYGIIMNIEKEKLGLHENSCVDIIDIKCPPELCGSLRLNKGFFPAYHMNKEHWISIILDGSVESSKIRQMIDLSYELSNYKK